MTERNYSFRYLKHIPNTDGTVRHYVLQVVDSNSGETEEILITPRELISPISMKRVLLGRKILYLTTRKKHEEMLEQLFSSPPNAI
jgi:hypothetical protein